MDAIRQLFLNRSIRLQSQVGKPGNLVRFSSNAYVDEGQPQEIAQRWPLEHNIAANAVGVGKDSVPIELVVEPFIA